MGQTFSSKNNLNVPLIEYNNNSRKTVEEILIENMFYKEKIDKLEENIDKINKNYSANIFTLNENIMLIKTDLETLVNNDKLLFEAIYNTSSVSNSVLEQPNNLSNYTLNSIHYNNIEQPRIIENNTSNNELNNRYNNSLNHSFNYSDSNTTNQSV